MLAQIDIGVKKRFGRQLVVSFLEILCLSNAQAPYNEYY